MLRAFIRDERGAAAEFAMVLPLAVIFMFAIIDGGRYLWEVNRAEKATQAGARIAAVTAMIPQGVADYSYSISAGVPQGAAVGTGDFPGVTCTGAVGSVDCAWLGSPNNAYALNPNAAAFDQIFKRMTHFLPNLEPAEVQVVYSNSGLGFAGDPTGPDVAPIITVRLLDVDFTPWMSGIFGTWGLPSSDYSLPQEDGIGTCFEEHPGASAAACDLG